MLILGLFILLLVSAISSERINGIIINRTAALILLYSFILSVSTLNVSIIGAGIGVFGGLYQITVISKIVECFIYLLGAMILSNTVVVLKNNISGSNDLNIKSEYPIVALFTVVGGILLIASNDLVSMYLSIELQSFGLYVLATIYRDSQSATSAGLKYFLLGGLSSGFILLGSTIIYASLGVTNLESIYLLMSVQVMETNEAASLFESLSAVTAKSFRSAASPSVGLLVLVTGFLFKIAAAPLHNWSPDVYDGVPTKVTSWLAIMAKISILTFLLDLVIGSASLTSSSLSSLSNLMLISAFLSLLVGTVVGLAQSRIKRLLAYSTISHVGFLLLAIAINTEDSIESFIFYLIQYSLTSANAFFVLIAFGSLSLTLTGERKFLSSNKSNDLTALTHLAAKKRAEKVESTEAEYSPVQFISQLKGQFNANNSASALLALSLSVVLFSMAGIPPLVGFFAKQAVLLAAVKNGFVFLSLVAIVTSVISAAYYLRVIKVMLFDPYPSALLQFNSSLVKNKETFKDKGPLSKYNLNDRKDKGSLKLNKNNKNEDIDLTFLENSYKGEMSNSLSFSISILTVLTIVFVLKPLLILNSAHIMALSLFYL
jgi:NADH-ubiquinone oxidoreductase chain 2